MKNNKTISIPDLKITEGEKVLAPTFEVATYPSIKLSDIKKRRFHIVDRAEEYKFIAEQKEKARIEEKRKEQEKIDYLISKLKEEN